MQGYAAVFRTGETLQEGCRQMSDVYHEMEDIKVRVYIYYIISTTTPILEDAYYLT